MEVTSCPHCNFPFCWWSSPLLCLFVSDTQQTSLRTSAAPLKTLYSKLILLLFQEFLSFILLFTIIYFDLWFSFTIIHNLGPNMPYPQAPHSASPTSLPLAMPVEAIFYSPTASQIPISRDLTSRSQPGSSANTSAAPSLTSCSNTRRTTTDCGIQNRAYPRIDLVEMLKTCLSSDMDTLALDRSLVRQAQT